MQATTPDPKGRRGVVVSLFSTGDDTALVEALRAGAPGAAAALFDRYQAHVQRVLVRVLGADDELPDLTQETFMRAFDGIDAVADPRSLKGWLTGIAVHTARGCIRRRQRRRWLRYFGWDDLPEAETPAAPDDVATALRAAYAILDKMPVDERIAFALRFIDGMELTEVAAGCEASVATIKRRLSRAEARFVAAARREPALLPWLQQGGRWSTT